MNFLFPERLEQFQLIKDVTHLEDLIKEENKLQLSKISYRCVIRKEKYIYAKCKFRKCSSYLRFHQNEGQFTLVKFINQHSHSSEGTRSALYKKIEEQISELPLSVSMATARHIICQKYKIEQACFYYLFGKVKNRKITYLQLMNQMMEKKYQVQSDPYHYGMTEIPNLMIVVTPLMKENFNAFGHWMGFDFTYNIIQDVNQQGREWRIGIFTGISSSKKIVPFGLVVCNQQTKERYYQILKSFSDIMNRLPSIIITDEDAGVISALETLKESNQFDGSHLLDCFHILRNVKKNLVKKEHWGLFNRMIRERSAENFEKIKDQCLLALDNEKDIQTLKRFLSNSTKFCFCKVPNSLFGFMPNTSMNQKMHDLIKSMLPYSKPFTVVVKKIVLYLEQLGLKCHQYELDPIKYEDLFHYPPLKELRYTVCKTIMKEIVSELSMSFHHQLFFVTDDRYIIKNSAEKEYAVAMIDGEWMCQCQYLAKTGIFCSHLAKVVMSLRLQLINYINARWKLKIDESKNIVKKYRFQRKTRRRYKK